MHGPLIPAVSLLDSGAITAALCNEANTSNTGQYNSYTDFGTLSIGSGVCTLALPSPNSPGNTILAKTGTDIASGKFLIIGTVTARSVTGSPAYQNCGIGIVKGWSPGVDDPQVLLAGHNAVSGNIRFEYGTGSGITFAGGVARSLTPPYSLALCCDGGRRVQMWTKSSGGVWTFGSSLDISAAFNWGSFTFTGWKAGMLVSCPLVSSWSFDNLKAVQRFR